MISYLPMVNAWSLLYDVLNGTLDKEYPIMNKKEIDEKTGLWKKPDPIEPSLQVGAGNTALDKVRDDITGDGLDYETDYYEDYMADVDEQRAHHFTNAHSPYNDGWTQQIHQEQLEKMAKTDHNFKYHEDEILKDIQEYVSRTYQGHYTGTKHEFRKVQTIDLMAARDIATDFCQANILKYGSRYGSKNGKNKTDLLKVIHYAMLLLHFDGHYGEPSMPSGNFDQMP